MSIRIKIGVTSEYVNNSISIELPDSTKAPHLYTAALAKNLLVLLCDLFAPDRALWASNAQTREQAEPDEELPGGGIAYGQLLGYASGWGTYLADSNGTGFDQSLLPESARIQRLEGGTLITVGDDPANPPLEDVLQVRLAMGYDVPRHPELRMRQPKAAKAGIGVDDAKPVGASKKQSPPTVLKATDPNIGTPPDLNLPRKSH